MIYMIRIGLLLSVPPVFQTPTPPAWPFSQVYLPFPPQSPLFVFFRLESVSHSQTQPIKLMTLKVLEFIIAPHLLSTETFSS